MENKRKFPRFETAFQVKYCPEHNNRLSSYTIASDVSRGGLRIPIPSGIINKGDAINLDMKTNDGKRHILAIGIVKWLKSINRNAPLDEEAGIEFVETNPSDIDRLIKSNK